jgi:hypothetical protein
MVADSYRFPRTMDSVDSQYSFPLGIVMCLAAIAFPPPSPLISNGGPYTLGG